MQKREMTLDEFKAQELGAVADVVSFCNNIEISIHSETSLVSSPESLFRGSLFSQGRLLGEEYLLNFQPSSSSFARPLGISNYNSSGVIGALANRRAGHGRICIQLPPPQPVQMNLEDAIRTRRSFRDFSPSIVSESEIGSILYYAQGVTGRRVSPADSETSTFGQNHLLEQRAAPSGGGLHPIDLYVIANRVANIAPAIYHYFPSTHSLAEISTSASIDELAGYGDLRASGAAFAMIFIYNLYENSRKYGHSGMAFAFIEVGQISQNIHLACTGLGIGSCDVGGIKKQTIERHCAVDGLTQHAIHLILVGRT
ncbi:SagB/ThcOx family dehydrogenase [Rhizobium leguminosarum]|uniref:SagB/ThcOx family dehydrogenase n=1 Tax=Rhizobium leguminosarum TaxID=384 RepID=UPI0009B74B4F|nr:SagB/ThcOx family dehydrogenase [Rhizobium leguminosarum]